MKPIQFAIRHRNLLLLAVSIVLGALAAFGARGYISGQLAIERERLAPRSRLVQIIVAKRDLARGEQVSAETMAVREVPQEYAPAGVVGPEQFEAIAGGSVTHPMRSGEPILQSSVAAPDSVALSARLKRGIRALTIAVDDVNSIAGMLQPGDRIDLLLSIRLPGGSSVPLPQEVTRPLMQDLRVLATGRQTRAVAEERQPRVYSSITIEVAPDQAQKLIVAQRSGKLTALLRNPGDRELLPPRAMDVHGLLDIHPVAPVIDVRRPAEVIVGGVGGLRPGDRQAAPSLPTPMATTANSNANATPATPATPAAAGSPDAPLPSVQAMAVPVSATLQTNNPTEPKGSNDRMR